MQKPEELGLPSILQRPETPYNPKNPDKEDQQFFNKQNNSPRNAAEKIKRLVNEDFFKTPGETTKSGMALAHALLSKMPLYALH
jgi:hypothetical protein